MDTAFRKVALFGGAITAHIPSGFTDVSNLRPVPDNQEIYLDANGFTSLTVDITERVSHLSTDREALDYHFADIVDEGDSKEIQTVVENMTLPKFPSNTPVFWLMATTTPPQCSDGIRPSKPTHTDIYFTLIRLVEQSTDIVITLNVPHISGETQVDIQRGDVNDSKETAQIMEGICKEVVESLEIRDWTLFDG